MDCAKTYGTCVQALKGFMGSTGFTEVVLGLSGGMDSSLAAVMCADALGAQKVHAVLLPGPYTSDASNEDALALANALRMDALTVSIERLYTQAQETLALVCGGCLDGLAAQNTQARLRMVCLMALSNTYGWMLLNTGNKSEACMGYSTLYGDSVGAFAILGNLYKTEVYDLARWRNAQAQKRGELAPIPMRVIERPPSAELAPNQEDESSLGVDYPTLDALLKAHVEEGAGEEELVARGFEASLVRRTLARYRSNAFKRRIAPPTPLRLV